MPLAGAGEGPQTINVCTAAKAPNERRQAHTIKALTELAGFVTTPTEYCQRVRRRGSHVVYALLTHSRVNATWECEVCRCRVASVCALPACRPSWRAIWLLH